MMTSSIFAILFGLVFLVCLCAGQISLPPEGDTIYAFPGQNVTIVWKVDDGLTVVSVSWTLLSQNGSLADIGIGVTKNTKHSPGPFTIKRPYTLILENVNMQYNGTYRFSILVAGGQTYTSDVTVIIPEKPNVNLSCPSRNEVNEGNNVTCVCRGVGGNPPANVTWYKGEVKIDETKKEINTLTLKNVNETNDGNYTCLARSYPDPMYEDNETIVVRVYFKPIVTSFKFSLNPAKLGDSVIIKCEARGFPEPNYTLTLNGTIPISAEKTYNISEVKWNDTGTYNCTATNTLGSHSVSKFLDVTEQGATTPNPTSISSSNSKASPASNSATSSTGNNVSVYTPTNSNGTSSTNIGLIIGIVIGVLVLIVIVAVLLYCYKSKDRDGRNCGNIGPAAGNHYELDEDAGPADNAYDSVGPVGTSSGKSKPPEKKNTLPPVYAAVDKNNRQGNTLYASLDTDAMKPKRESKKEPERTPQTEYASIDFAKRADDNVPKADLV